MGINKKIVVWEDTFPSPYHVRNFTYNGSYGNTQKGFAKWVICDFVRWTEDPGIGTFICSDNKNRYIPTFAIHPEYARSLPKQSYIHMSLTGVPTSSK